MAYTACSDTQAGPSCPSTTPCTKARSNTICAATNQGAGFAAIGYARASGNTGVCFATSGPGATNLVTALADALLDSVPVVAITGQVSQAVAGTDAFQEVDVLGMSFNGHQTQFLCAPRRGFSRDVARGVFAGAKRPPGPSACRHPKRRAIGTGQRALAATGRGGNTCRRSGLPC